MWGWVYAWWCWWDCNKTRYSRMTFASALRSFKVCYPSVWSIWVTLYVSCVAIVTHYKAGCSALDHLDLVLGWVDPAGQGIFQDGTYIQVYICLFLRFSWTALHLSAEQTSCAVSFLTHAVDTGFPAELGVDSDPEIVSVVNGRVQCHAEYNGRWWCSSCWLFRVIHILWDWSKAIRHFVQSHAWRWLISSWEAEASAWVRIGKVDSHQQTFQLLMIRTPADHVLRSGRKFPSGKPEHQIPEKLWHPALPAERGLSESPLSTIAGCPVVPMKQVSLEAVHVAPSQIRFWRSRLKWHQPAANHEDCWRSHGWWEIRNWKEWYLLLVWQDDMSLNMYSLTSEKMMCSSILQTPGGQWVRSAVASVVLPSFLEDGCDMCHLPLHWTLLSWWREDWCNMRIVIAKGTLGI